MLDLVQTPSHVAAFRLTGEITRLDFEQIVAEIEARLSLHPRIAIYADMQALTRLSLDAWLSDIAYRFAKRKQLHRFGRLALVADQTWARTLSTLARPFLPFESRVFHAGEQDEALAYCMTMDPDASEEPGLRMISTTRPDTYAFVWDGKIKRRDLDRIARILELELETHISVRMLGRLEHMRGIEVRALLNPRLVHAKLLGARKVERYALVGDAGWLPGYVALVGRLSDIEMRHFPLSREADAWAWLQAQPVLQADRPSGSQLHA